MMPLYSDTMDGIDLEWVVTKLSILDNSNSSCVNILTKDKFEVFFVVVVLQCGKIMNIKSYQVLPVTRYKPMQVSDSLLSLSLTPTLCLIVFDTCCHLLYLVWLCFFYLGYNTDGIVFVSCDFL